VRSLKITLTDQRLEEIEARNAVMKEHFANPVLRWKDWDASRVEEITEEQAYLLSLVRTQTAEIKRLKAGQRKAVKEGMKEGTRALAIWKDGRHLVGVLAKPLDTVLREIDDEVGYAAVVVSAALARLEEQT